MTDDRSRGPEWALMCDFHLTAEQVAHMKRQWESEYHSKVLILGRGATIKRLVPRIAGGRPGVTMGLRS